MNYSITRTTTPLQQFILDFSYSQFVEKILITYKQGDTIVLEKTENDITVLEDDKTIQYKLTQEESKNFNPNAFIDIQVKVKTFGGDVLASKKYMLTVKDVLDDRVL